jgi:release factor glutamine methyltransferase
MTNIQSAWQSARATFPDPNSASLEAQLLLAHVLEKPREYILAHTEDLLTSEQWQAFQALAQRRAQGEPYAYLVGYAHFYNLTFAVSPAVLIPRPETELLVEEALNIANTYTQPVIADIGVGSGAIAITVAKHSRNAHVYGVDISPQALAITRTNIQRHNVDNLMVFEGSLAQPLVVQGIRVNLLLANLPYIPTQEMLALDVSRHEPHLALDGGDDGLVLVRELLQQASQVCQPNATILLEIGSGQSPAVQALASALGKTSSVIYDYAQHDRIVKIQW